MKTIFLFILLSTHIFSQVCSQELKSEWSSISLRKNAILSAKDSLPPVISLISPHIREDDIFKSNAERFTVIATVKDDISVSSVLINSVEIVPNSGGTVSKEISLKEGLNTIILLALDANSNVAERKVKIMYIPEAVNNEVINVTGDFYALLIGVNDYKDPNIVSLENPIRDANAVRKVLCTKYIFNPENVLLLENPSNNDILEAFDKLSRELDEDDNLLIFYAGHGWWDSEASTGFWFPADADNVSRTRWIRNSTIQDYMKELKVKHSLLITDACFSGGIFSSRSVNTGASLAVKTMYETPSRKAMTSGAFSEVSDNSAFVKYLVDRLNKNDEKYLSADELFRSFRTAVMNNSEVIPQYGVIKNTGDEGGEFIFIAK